MINSCSNEITKAIGRVFVPWMLLAFLILMLIGCGRRVAAPATPPTPANMTPAEALQSAVSARDWQTASSLAQEAMIASPNDPDVLTNAAVAKAQSGLRVEAAHLLVEAVEATDYSSQGGRIDNALAALLDVGHLYDAIDLLEEVVRRERNATDYRRMLVGFLGEAQLTEDAEEHMKILIEQRQFDLPLLLATTETSSRRYSQNTIDMLLRRNPDDLRPRLGEAKHRLDERDAAGAEEVLREILRRTPNFAAAHAMLGSTLVAQGKTDELMDWFRSVPNEASDYSGYWVGAGGLALALQSTGQAVRAFGEATRRAPNDSANWALLREALRQWRLEDPSSNQLDVDAVIASMVDRQAELLRLRDRFAAFKDEGQKNQSLAFDVAKSLDALGRLWEAEAWLAIATTLREQPDRELVPYRNELLTRLQRDRAWQSTDQHPELAFELSDFALPTDLAGTTRSDAVASKRVVVDDQKPIRMTDVAAELGIEFYGRVGDRVNGPRIPITQTLGCGGGMFDFDRDGRSDLVFAAAGGNLRVQDSDPGVLLRNTESFVDVSQNANFGDRGYSQGIVVGDLNDDGFHDLIVLNLGPNRVFRNNGDGTFSDATDLLGDQSNSQWSTSGAILDINGDGYSDVVIANYCDSRDPLEAPCFDAEGQEINCYPLEYRAARDQVLAGQPDGSFDDRSEPWIGSATLGRGLGIVAGRLDGRNQGIYVVNDASPNTYYRWLVDDGRLDDQGIISGLAVDAQSLDQGSMGIASSDFDHDGDLDFYVTGFANEYNIFYDQISSGFWSDRTAAMGIVDDTLKTVGFGTEAIDLDNDGVDEIAVTNGHVGIFQPPVPPYAQPFQLFQRNRSGGFDSAALKNWGEYFQQPHVGRCLFSGDFNGDGLCDAVVTHANEPVAVLANESEASNHRLTLRLVDRDSCRDGVGAIVDLEIGDANQPKSRRYFQLAGHGYLCSNEQVLWIGTGRSTVAKNVSVTWPDGTSEPLGDLKADAAYIVVRGEEPFQLATF